HFLVNMVKNEQMQRTRRRVAFAKHDICDDPAYRRYLSFSTTTASSASKGEFLLTNSGTISFIFFTIALLFLRMFKAISSLIILFASLTSQGVTRAMLILLWCVGNTVSVSLRSSS